MKSGRPIIHNSWLAEWTVKTFLWTVNILLLTLDFLRILCCWLFMGFRLCVNQLYWIVGTHLLKQWLTVPIIPDPTSLCQIFQSREVLGGDHAWAVSRSNNREVAGDHARTSVQRRQRRRELWGRSWPWQVLSRCCLKGEYWVFDAHDHGGYF